MNARQGRRLLIGGGSGFIGSALSDALIAEGWQVTVISRTPGAGKITWEDLERDGLPACDAVVNLAGRHILDLRRRWTPTYRHEVIQSRVQTTRALVKAINEAERPPAVFVSTSGKCFYGTDESETFREDSPPGEDFPGQLSILWEKTANEVDAERLRHVHVRIGVVLGRVAGKALPIGAGRGFLPIIRLPFCLGCGGFLGSGRQYFPWIHIEDMTGILVHAIENEDMRGVYNAVSPNIVSNETFTRSFAKRLRRPILWHIPAFLVHLVIGKERAGILLEGQKVSAERTLQTGYRFRFPTIDAALDDLVKIFF